MINVKSDEMIVSWMRGFCNDSGGAYEFSDEYAGIIYKDESVVSVFTNFLSYLKKHRYAVSPESLSHIRVNIFDEMQIMSFRF